jgi:hypothetical protein
MMHSRILSRVLTKNQKVVLSLSKSVSASLSLIASSIIIYKIYLRYKLQPSKSNIVVHNKKDDNSITTYHRMLLGISILDVIHSISSVFSSLLVPPYTHATFANGTTATCSIQGALQQLTPSIVIYMTMLNIYFMLKIRYNISDTVIHSRYEVWLHAIPMIHFLTTAITGLSMRIYGPIILPELGCWLDSFCVYTNTCTRSGPIFYNHLDFYAWSFAYIWLFICVFVVTINSVLIYTSIRNQEQRNAKYLAARLQSEGQFNSSSILYPSNIPNSPHEFDYGDNNEESATEMTEIAHMKDLNKYGKDLFLKNDVEPSVPKEPEPIVNEEPESLLQQEPAHESNNEDVEQHIVDNETDEIPANVSSTNCTRGVKVTQKIKQSRIAAVQGLLYVSSAFFTAVWIFMPWLGVQLQVNTHWRFFFAFMVSIVSPSQGLFSLFIFVRLQYLRYRNTNKEWSRWKCVKQCLFTSDE